MRTAGDTRVEPPDALLAIARDLLDRVTPETAGLWPRASALLARQALEMAMDDFWSSHRLPLASCSTFAQLLCLREYLGNEHLAGGIHHAWNALSGACHQHPYELPPNGRELARWIEVIEEFAARGMGGKAPHPLR